MRTRPLPVVGPLTEADQNLLDRLDAMSARHIGWRQPWQIIRRCARRLRDLGKPRPGRWDGWLGGFRPRRPTVPRDLLEKIGDDGILAGMCALYVGKYGYPSKEDHTRREMSWGLRTALLFGFVAQLALASPWILAVEMDIALTIVALLVVLWALVWATLEWSEPDMLLVEAIILTPVVLMVMMIGPVALLASPVPFVCILPVWGGSNAGWGMAPEIIPRSPTQLNRAYDRWCELTEREPN